MTGHTGTRKHGSLYATLHEGVNGKRFPSASQVRTLTGFAAGEYDAPEMPSEPDPIPAAAGELLVANVRDFDGAWDEACGGSHGQRTSSTGEVDRARRDRDVRCPKCHRMTPWRDNPQRPFCSLTCRLIDLGVWLDEFYVVRGDDPGDVR
jgi:endogenous inhibitor of DNA gyrase (YacG/DUF329 family)